MTNFWDHFWLREVPPHALAIVRIALGLYLLVYAGLYIPNLSVLFSSDGFLLPLYLDRFPEFSLFLAPPSPLVTHIIYAVFLLCIAGIALGAFFRFSVFGTIAISLYLWQLQLHGFATSYNRILLLCLLVLLFSGAHRTLSFDQWRRSGSIFHWEPISILPQRLIALQITATFIGVGLQKLWLPLWTKGEVLAYSFISRWTTPLSRWYSRLPLTIASYDVVVILVKILQPTAAVGLWIPRVRLPCIALWTMFLLLVATMLSIWWFLFIIPAFILFYEPETVFSWCRTRYGDRIPKKPVKLTK
ncbi:MAG: HTTM domain-containing protein [Candidatus Peribacteraceae bacterium]|jgi:hypothetical protein|nr:hypothetical protein [bacterium]MDP6561486.1 HTTM domain-containing protein [Candidatus Peribacteraceae bacterium]|tara:strand:- start:15743 stop:16648 length:906 start_codon:yes stop_codon:yes gene_type:complete